MVKLTVHWDVVFPLIGNTLLAVIVAVGFARRRDISWLLLCLWAILDLAASVIEGLISCDYIALRHAARWIEVRSTLWLLAKLFLLFALGSLAFRRRPLHTPI